MAIVKMKKITLAAPKDSKSGILDILQSEGCVQIIDPKDVCSDSEDIKVFINAGDAAQIETDFNSIKFTYEFMKQYSNKKDGLFKKKEVIEKSKFDSLENAIDWKSKYNSCMEIDKSMNNCKNNRAKLSALIEQYEEWESMDVSSGELESLVKTAYFVGTINNRYEKQLYDDLYNESDDLYFEVISRKQQNLNFIVLCHKDDADKVTEILKRYAFSKSVLKYDKPVKEYLAELKAQIEALDGEFEDLILRAKELSKDIADIEKMHDYFSNKLDKINSFNSLLNTEDTVILQGWLPGNKADEISKAVLNYDPCAYVDYENPTEEESPPVILKNKSLFEPFEVITSMYSLPDPKEVDPTPIMALFYMLFFGMMMADIGYGLMMAVGSIIMLKFTEIEGSTRKVIKLILYCSIPTVIFGLLYGSFFGGIIELKPLWVNPLDSTMEVLVVSIGIGIIHIFTGLGIKAYKLIKSGSILDAVYDVFLWYGLIIGLIWLGIGGGTFPKILSIVSAAGLLLTQGRSNATIAGKFFGGLYGLYGITSYVGDALSYSRLLALGLASGLIGWSFKLIIDMLGGGAAAIIFGPVIFVAGHLFNFFVGGLGTFVHACRLQYLEFFGKFYDGGGSEFKPLKINTQFIKLNIEK